MANFLTTAMLFFTGFTLPLVFVQVAALGPFGITPNKITVAGLLALAVVLGVLERRQPPRNPKGWWVAAFAASMLIGATISLTLGVRLEQMFVVATILSAVVVFYFLVIYVTRSIKDLDTLFIGLILGVALASVSVLMRWGVVQQNRTGGFAGDPNNFAFVASTSLPILGYYYATVRSRFVKISLIAIAGLDLIAIAASLSRTGMVILFVISFMWMARFRRFDILRIAIPVGILVAAALFIGSPALRERMNTIVDPEAAAEDGSISKRVLQNTLAVEAFVTNPILGVGYQQFGNWAGGRINRTTAIHNAYLHVMAELGLLGIISFLGLIGATYVEYSRARQVCRSVSARGDPVIEKLYLMATLLQISLVGAIVGNLFLSSLRYRISWMLYACSTIVLIFARQRAKELSSEEPTEARERPEFRPAHMFDTGPEQPLRA